MIWLRPADKSITWEKALTLFFLSRSPLFLFFGRRQGIFSSGIEEENETRKLKMIELPLLIEVPFLPRKIKASAVLSKIVGGGVSMFTKTILQKQKKRRYSFLSVSLNRSRIWTFWTFFSLFSGRFLRRRRPWWRPNGELEGGGGRERERAKAARGGEAATTAKRRRRRRWKREGVGLQEPEAHAQKVQEGKANQDLLQTIYQLKKAFFYFVRETVIFLLKDILSRLLPKRVPRVGREECNLLHQKTNNTSFL